MILSAGIFQSRISSRGRQQAAEAVPARPSQARPGCCPSESGFPPAPPRPLHPLAATARRRAEAIHHHGREQAEAPRKAKRPKRVRALSPCRRSCKWGKHKDQFVSPAQHSRSPPNIFAAALADTAPSLVCALPCHITLSPTRRGVCNRFINSIFFSLAAFCHPRCRCRPQPHAKPARPPNGFFPVSSSRPMYPERICIK